MTVDELQVLVTANSTQFQKEMGKVQNELKKISGQAEETGRRVPRSFLKSGAGAVALGNIITKVISTAFRALSDSMDGAIKRLDTIKNYPRVMSSLGYSTSDAEKSVQILSDRLLGLPTSLDQMINATQQLATVSPTLASATERALALNNAFLAGGQGAEASSRGLVQFNQMLATGKADMQSWKILMEVMPGQLKQLSTSLLGAGANGIHLQDAITEGTITMQQLADEVVNLNKKGLEGFGSFEEQARNATGGVGTAIVNVQIAIQRGLATILDAIGQANISGFFNGIANAIGVVIPYVVAFVQSIMMAVGWVQRLFGGAGGGGAKKMESDVAKTAGSMGKVAGSAGTAGEAIGGASKKAKELKKQLAGFDEMNVLTEDKGSDGGGGGGGAGGVGGGIPMEFPDTAPVEKGLSRVDGILKALANNPFVKGFLSVFEAIGEAIKFVIEKVKEFAGWLASVLPEPIVNFFKTIKENEVVGTILTAVGYALGVIAGALTVGLLVFGLWTAVTAIATLVTTGFSIALGVLMSPIVLIVAGIALLIVGIVALVKNWDKVKEVAITVWDKIKEVWKTVGEWINTEVVIPVINFFTGLWDWIKKWGGWILLAVTAPFALAVIAVIKNWDTIKEKASQLWDGIKSIFGGVADWFREKFNNAVTKIKEVFNAIPGFFGGMWGQIKDKFSTIGSAIGDAIGGAFKTVINAILGFAESKLNGFINLINGAIRTVNKLPGVSIGEISNVSVPRLARGGVVDGATMAVIGEAGKEAVVPLENNTGWIDMIASKLDGAMGNSSQPIQLTVKIGEDTLIRKIIDGVKDREYMLNDEVFI